MELLSYTSRYKGDKLKFYELFYKLSDGNIKKYEIVSRKDSLLHIIDSKSSPSRFPTDGVCGIVTDRSNRHILVIKKFRPALNTWVWCLPEGTIEKHETAEEAIRREVFEETGIILDTVRIPTMPGFVCDAISDVRIFTAYCDASSRRKPRPEDNPSEPIEAYWMDRRAALELLAKHDCINVRLQMALLSFVRFRP